MPGMHIETTTPTVARVPRARRRASVALAAVACASLLGACGSSSSTSSSSTATSLDTHRVALSIQRSILEKRHLQATVSCPTSVHQEQGATFQCVATTHSASGTVSKTPFKVTVQNSKGYVTYVGE
jgi:hypothetical protein